MGKRKITNKEFLERIEKIVPERSYEIVGEYINCKTPIIVKDEFGLCKMRSGELLKGSKPSLISAIDKTKYWKNKAHKVHNRIYGYEKVVYTKNTDTVEIKCKKHGYFKQKLIDHMSGNGCQKCSKEKRRDGQNKSLEKFLEESIEKHGYKFDYSQVIYLNVDTDVIIGCPEHGYYNQTPYHHLKGKGCRKCALNRPSNFNIKTAKRNRKEWSRLESNVYLIKIKSTEATFFKIGVSKEPEIRFYNICKVNDLEIIEKEIISCNLYTAVIKEQEVLDKYKEYKYQPLINFAGYTECFNLGLPVDKIIEELNLS